MPQSFPQKTPPSTGNRSHSETVQHLRQLSHLLDNAIPIPGTKYRLGLDPLLGLIPAGGDIAGALLSAYIVLRASQMGLPASSLGRMGLNILLEMLLGIVPILGDFFDVAWKANVMNVKLLEAHVASSEPAQAADKRLVILLVAGIVLLAIALAMLTVTILGWLLGGLGNLF